MKQSCIRCGRSDVSFYKSRRNVSGLEYICKQCKKIKLARNKYKVSEQFIEYLYSFETCMCCGAKFKDKHDAHIHHIEKGVQGLVCRKCNLILGQETEEDLHRIDSCLSYMRCHRVNFIDRGNQQERLQPGNMAINLVKESSETTCRESRTCSQCKRKLTKDSFHNYSRRRICVDCRRWVNSLSQSKEAKQLRNEVDKCECCECDLRNVKKCVHHVGEVVYGVVCDRCNQLLGNESGQRKDQLLNCKLWIEGSLLDNDIVRSAWRHAELGRNDLAYDMVA